MSVVAVMAALAAMVPAQTITVVNHSRASAAQVRRVERAVEIQSRQVARAWGTPTVSFGPDGWPLVLVNADLVSQCLGAFPHAACHQTTDSNVPIGYVGMRYSRKYWSMSFSHEVIEMLVDPYLTRLDRRGNLVEVCDPVADRGYWLAGVYVAQFTHPAHWMI